MNFDGSIDNMVFPVAQTDEELLSSPVPSLDYTISSPESISGLISTIDEVIRVSSPASVETAPAPKKKRGRKPSQHLSKEERARLKRLKNREAAQRLRDKNQTYVQTLEKRMDSLNNEKSCLTSELDILKRESQSMKQEIALMKKLLTGNNTKQQQPSIAMPNSGLKKAASIESAALNSLPLQQELLLLILCSIVAVTNHPKSPSTLSTTNNHKRRIGFLEMIQSVASSMDSRVWNGNYLKMAAPPPLPPPPALFQHSNNHSVFPMTSLFLRLLNQSPFLYSTFALLPKGKKK
eukprot:Nk52_evm1s2440 gene=Nk52_evmTU1s2440